MPNGRRQPAGGRRLAAGGWRLATGDWPLATMRTGNRTPWSLCSRFPVPGSVFPVPSIPDSLFPIPYSRFPPRFWPRCQAMKPAPIGAEHLDRHFIALSEATRDKPLRERSILPPQPQLVPNGETEAPVLPVEVALGETMKILLGCGGDQVVQRV